ncbi:hypothetical protein [Marinobacter sp. CHS3-4]|uniref:hypothetical protein n=1 Tax=Marinobacter sp. CHS3-4 TaxID=3045174 RepID=UPI0024B4A5DD|nr:hypothetical protein [Marinobacter sp. CHS3-4]MDI9246936.1 hypothetical protein [Marinobacter sp. CHS3-4]
MPTNEQLQMWAEEVATTAAPFGEAASVAIGMPDITCAYLINLINRLLLKIAQDTALTGMTAQEAQAYKDLQVLRARIIRACDETQTPEPPDEEEPPTDGPGDSVKPPEPPKPIGTSPQPPLVEPEPVEQEPTCCDIHGHQLPSLDFTGLNLRARSGGVVIGGAVVSNHPCGFRYWDLKVVLVGPNGTRTEVYRNTSRVGSPSEQLSLALPSSLVRGFRSGFVEVTVESNCRTSNRAIRSNYGWVIKPGSPTTP